MQSNTEISANISAKTTETIAKTAFIPGVYANIKSTKAKAFATAYVIRINFEQQIN